MYAKHVAIVNVTKEGEKKNIMQFDVTNVVIALIGLLCTLCTGVFIPWLSKKNKELELRLGEDKYAILKNIVITAVQAAEQVYESDKCQEKKAQVVANVTKELEAKGIYFCEETVSDAIEAAVLDLHAFLER